MRARGSNYSDPCIAQVIIFNKIDIVFLTSVNAFRRFEHF